MINEALIEKLKDLNEDDGRRKWSKIRPGKTNLNQPKFEILIKAKWRTEVNQNVKENFFKNQRRDISVLILNVVKMIWNVHVSYLMSLLSQFRIYK